MNGYRVDKKIKADLDYYGFKLRTRYHFFDANIIKEILLGDYYRMPPNPKVVVDIGANIGTFSLLAVRVGAEVVYAFEPEQFNYEILLHNIEINGYQDKIHCINKGVGKQGETKLYIHPHNSGASSSCLDSMLGLEPDKFQMMQVISIREVFDSCGIKYCDLLKLDCEGGEKDIIGDLDDDLVNRIGQISVEFHDKGIKWTLIDKLKKWYKGEYTDRHRGIWVFKKV